MIYQIRAHQIIVADWRTQSIDNSGLVIYDPEYDEPGAFDDIERIRPCDHTALAVFCDPFTVDSVIVSSLCSGWNFRFLLTLDGTSSWYTPGRPLLRSKHCVVFGRFDYDKQGGIVPDGKIRNSVTTWNSRGVYQRKSVRGKQLSTVETTNYSQMKKWHKHQKPIEWITAIIGCTGAKTVIDLYGGSCGSIIACENIGVICTCYEIDEATAASANNAIDAILRAPSGELFEEASNGY